MFQTVFKRYELKYLLTTEQRDRILSVMQEHMTPDKYGRTTIRNLYFDTDTYLLIRRSMEKPLFKEKLRVRSYSLAGEGDTVFAELKRKYDGVVYKRRLAAAENRVMDWLSGRTDAPEKSQISHEIDYFLRFYGELHPTVFLSYDRQAYYSRTDGSFRITFDENILARETALTLGEEAYGTFLLPEGKVLMEIKCAGGIPLWMTAILSAEHIYKTSFSKYGTAYTSLIFPRLQSENKPYIKENPYHVS
ncbi:MAG: polyphosphate polymerase domain-containing protein [Ruminococcaceae bacterium]|nr:polyphosphate polymerase domain-containing protein [Oscillospiraceae bacterium]